MGFLRNGEGVEGVAGGGFVSASRGRKVVNWRVKA